MANAINFANKAGLVQALQQLGVTVNVNSYTAQQLSDMLTQSLQGAQMMRQRASGAEMQLSQLRTRSIIALAVTAIPLTGIVARALYMSGIEGIKTFFGFGSADSQSTALVEAKAKELEAAKAECDQQLAVKSQKFNSLVNLAKDFEKQRDVAMDNWKQCLENAEKQGNKQP